MSLIQDALRRQQEEFETSQSKPEPATGPVATEPSVPAEMPIADVPAPTAAEQPGEPAPPPAGRAGRPGMLIAGILVLATVTVVAGGLLVLFFGRKTGAEASRTATEQIAVVQPAAPLQPAATAPEPAPPTTVPATKVQPVEPAVPAKPNTEDKASVAAVAELSPTPAANAPPERRAEVKAELPGGGASAAKAAPAPVATPPLEWPRLRLSGILNSMGAGAARINNRMVFVGEKIEGVTLVEIQADSVVLHYGNETKLLKMGNILY